jgi:hypothetical protein
MTHMSIWEAIPLLCLGSIGSNVNKHLQAIVNKEHILKYVTIALHITIVTTEICHNSITYNNSDYGLKYVTIALHITIVTTEICHNSITSYNSDYVTIALHLTIVTMSQ